MTSSLRWPWIATVGLLTAAACAIDDGTRPRPASDGAAPASVDPKSAPAMDPARLLADVTAWDAATSADRRLAAESVATLEADFTLVKLETFSCGGQTHEVAIYWHDKTGMEFVLVPGGAFPMGSPTPPTGTPWTAPERSYDEETQHTVTLTQPFLLCRTECTQAAYEKVVGSNPSTFKGANRPVEGVGWEEAQGFCARLGFTLPTEAQWEWACRAGTRTTWSTGSETRSLQGYANIYDAYARAHFSEIPQERPAWAWNPTLNVSDGFATTAPVKTFAANAFGLYDMHGNVWEWCSDWYAPYPPGNATDPSGPSAASTRVVRGGSWFNPAGWVRSAARYGAVPDRRTGRIGFRPAKSIGP